MASSDAGGFVEPVQGLPSPSPSTLSNSTISSILPVARAHPLKPGSSKETIFRNYVDARMRMISRRFAKRFGGEEQNADVGNAKGYADFAEVARDMEALVDTIWVSGTRMQDLLKALQA